MSRMLTAACGLIAFVLATLFITAAAPGAGTPTYLDSHASINGRVNDLLSRMTLEEKVGQMDQIVIGKLRDTTSPANGDCNTRRQQRPAADDLPAEGADRLPHRLDPVRRHRQPDRQHRQGLGRAVQHHPALRHRALPAAHPGHLRGRRGARLRPPIRGHALPAVDRDGCDLGRRPRGGRRRVPPASSCWRPAGTGTSRRSRTSPATTAGAATTRPGPRSRELAAAIGAANIRGLQGGGFDSPQVAATVKHFAGYSQSINGHDRVEAQLPIRYLQDIFLPVLRRRHRRRRGDRDGRLRLDQQHPRDRLALPAHRGAAPPTRLQGRRDQRLRRRARAAERLPRRRRLARRDRQGGQRRHRREHDAVRLRRLEQRPASRTCTKGWSRSAASTSRCVGS